MLVYERTYLSTYCHRVKKFCNIVGQRLAADGQCTVRNLAGSLANGLCWVGAFAQGLGIAFHFLLQSILVGLAGYNSDVYVLELTGLLSSAEDFLHFVVLSLQIGIVNGDVSILNAGVGEGSQKNLALVVTSLEISLGSYRVADDGTCKQSLILLSQCLLADVLLNKLPVVVHLHVLLLNL